MSGVQQREQQHCENGQCAHDITDDWLGVDN
jgi:hypothetical protein